MSLLDDVTARGVEVRTRVRDLLERHEYPGDIKTHALVGYVDIALEHHKAIWLLKDAKLNGSALALVRPVFDTMLRAHWINKVATEEQIEQAFNDQLKLRMPKLFADFKYAYFDSIPPEEAAVSPEMADKFLQLLDHIWKVTSSYTHSGGLQLGRRFQPNGELKPNYSDADIAQALSSATVALLLLVHMFFVCMGRYDEMEEVRTLLRKCHADFNERLRNAQ